MRGVHLIALALAPCVGAQVVQPDTAVRGHLQSDDPVVHDGQRMDLLQIEAEAGQVLTVHLTSDAFDPQLRVVTPRGAVEINDDLGAGVTAAQITHTVRQSGLFSLFVASSDGEYGPYTLRATFGSPQSLRPALEVPLEAAGRSWVDLVYGDRLEGLLTVADAAGPFQQIARRYTFFGREGDVISVDMTSDTVDSLLRLTGPSGGRLAENDDSGGGLNARVWVRLRQTGVHRVEATTYTGRDTGPFSLALTHHSDVGSTSPTTVRIGQTVRGALEPSDALHPSRLNSFMDLYTFEAQAGETVRIDLEAIFDTYLYLLGPGGRTWQNDDGGVGFNSSLGVRILESGTHQIHVTSYHPQATGEYTLSVR